MAEVCKQKEHQGFIVTEYAVTILQANDFYHHVYKI